MAQTKGGNKVIQKKKVGSKFGNTSGFKKSKEGIGEGISQNKDDIFKAKMRIWVYYWRANLHRFASEMGVRLHFFQSILLNVIDLFPNFIYIASRGTGKSFLIALYAILKAILYPNIRIVISSATKGQSILMIKQYIRYFANEYDLIANEIENINDGISSPSVTFKNGSEIKAVTAADNARGNRCNILILEEFAIMKKSIIDSVLKKFGTVPRQPAYSYKIEWKGYPTEPNREIYISSARYKSEWGWDECKKFFKAMVSKQKKEDFFYGILSSDWKLPAEYGLTDEKKLRTELEVMGGDDITWSM